MVAEKSILFVYFALAQKVEINHNETAFQASSPKTFMARPIFDRAFFSCFCIVPDFFARPWFAIRPGSS